MTKRSLLGVIAAFASFFVCGSAGAQASSSGAIWCVGEARSGERTTWYSSGIATGVADDAETERRWAARVQQAAGEATVLAECHAAEDQAAAEFRRDFYREDAGEAPWSNLSYRPGDPAGEAPDAAPALAEAAPEPEPDDAAELAAAAERRARTDAALAAGAESQRRQAEEFRAAQARFEAETRRVQESNAQYERDMERFRRESAAVEADRRRYEREMERFRIESARVEACRAGDRTQCPPPTPR